MARIVPTLPPPRPVRQASVLPYPRGNPARPNPLPDKGRSNQGAWRWYRLPEVRKASLWTAKGVGRVSFAPALDVPGRTGDLCPPLIDESGAVADGVDERLARDAQALWTLIRSPLGGQADLWRGLATCLQVAGDGWLFAYPAGDDLAFDPDGEQVWVSLARYALDHRAGVYEVDVGTDGRVKVPTGMARAVRCWRPDPQRPAQADSWVLSAERDLERLEALYEAVAAVALSRMHAGVILAPSDQDHVPSGAMTTEQAEAVLGEPLRQRLYDELADHVEASAAELDGFARAVPPVIGLDSTLTDKVRWLELARSIDPEMRNLVDNLRYRIAIASDSPPEILLGLGDTNHWNKDEISAAEFQRAVQPDCELICDATTPHVLRAGLVAMGHSAEAAARVRVGYDPSALVDPPDRSASAVQVFEAGGLTDAELRDATGLAEYRGPDEDERRERLVLQLVTARPEYGYLLPELGLPAPPATPAAASEAEPVEEPVEEPAEEDEPTEAQVRQAAATPDDVGVRLADIGRRFEDRLSVLCGAILDRMAERASTKVLTLARRSSWEPLRAAVRSAPPDLRGAVPGVAAMLAAEEVDDDDLLGGALAVFASRFDAEVRRAQRQAVRAAGGDWDALEADAAEASAAGWALAARLLIGEARRRFDGDLAPDGEGEGVGVESLAVPTLLVRRVSAVVGGATDPGVSERGGALSGLLSVATGPLAQRALAQRATVVTGWRWDYGEEERATFEPHLDLDGTVSEDPFDFGGWFPGDHNGCRCRTVPVLAPASEVAA